jgi:hypothetical protein
MNRKGRNRFAIDAEQVFLRFVAGTNDEDYRHLTGVITQARILRDDGRLEAHETQWLEEIFEWFNNHLPCPPFSESHWSPDAVCWFRGVAGEPLQRMWDVVALLREHGTPIRVIRTANPGRIVYADEFQVVAEAW